MTKIVRIDLGFPGYSRIPSHRQSFDFAFLSLSNDVHSKLYNSDAKLVLLRHFRAREVFSHIRPNSYTSTSSIDRRSLPRGTVLSLVEGSRNALDRARPYLLMRVITF